MFSIIFQTVRKNTDREPRTHYRFNLKNQNYKSDSHDFADLRQFRALCCVRKVRYARVSPFYGGDTRAKICFKIYLALGTMRSLPPM